MCAWIITAVEPLDPNAAAIFDSDFEAHMMKGDVKAGSHRGLHSLNQILTQDFHIAEGNKVDDDNCPQVFSAKVSLVKNVAEVRDYGKARTWLAEKLSCFFPTSMPFKDIQTAVKLAYQNYKGRSTGMIRIMPKHQPHGNEGPKVDYSKAKTDSIHAFGSQLRRLHVTDVGTKWAGQVRIATGGESWVIWIGSPETGTSSSKLLSAFPAVRGKFI